MIARSLKQVEWKSHLTNGQLEWHCNSTTIVWCNTKAITLGVIHIRWSRYLGGELTHFTPVYCSVFGNDPLLHRVIFDIHHRITAKFILHCYCHKPEGFMTSFLTFSPGWSKSDLRAADLSPWTPGQDLYYVENNRLCGFDMLGPEMSASK